MKAKVHLLLWLCQRWFFQDTDEGASVVSTHISPLMWCTRQAARIRWDVMAARSKKKYCSLHMIEDTVVEVAAAR